MPKLLNLDGMKTFLQKMCDKFVSQENANLTYIKKSDLAEIENYLQNEFEKVEWRENGEDFTYGKIYENYIKLGGINSVENILVEEKAVTIPASAFDSETQITIESTGYSFSFEQNCNIKLEGEKTTLKGKGINLSVSNSVHNARISAQGGNYTVDNTGNHVTIDTANYDGTDFFRNSGDYCKIQSTWGNDSVINSGFQVTIQTGGYNYVYNTGDNASISSGLNSDTIYNEGNYVYIDRGIDNDSINNKGNYVTISGGNGAAIISLSGSNQLIGHNAWLYDQQTTSVYGFKSSDSIKILSGCYRNSSVNGSDFLIGTTKYVSSGTENGAFLLLKDYVKNGSHPPVIIIDEDGNSQTI